MFLTVTNNGGDDFASKYDGILYEFPKGKTITVPMAAAQHIFGIGQADKASILSKHGWLNHSSGLQAAMAKLNSFAFGILDKVEPEPLPDEILEEISTPKEQGSAPLQTGAGDKGSSDGLSALSATASDIIGKGSGSNKTITLKK
jgi:hypothetical protein